MQHYGAPTRLLDCSYSPFIAAFFALQRSLSSNSVVWCFNSDWFLNQAKSIAGAKIIDERNTDEYRNDRTFKELFMNKFPLDLVFIENPFSINERLNIQQGAFLCPANISKGFESNLQQMSGWDHRNSIVKIKFKLSKKSHVNSLLELNRMNINNAVLFPGLDGFSESLKQKLLIYK